MFLIGYICFTYEHVIPYFVYSIFIYEYVMPHFVYNIVIYSPLVSFMLPAQLPTTRNRPRTVARELGEGSRARRRRCDDVSGPELTGRQMCKEGCWEPKFVELHYVTGLFFNSGN